MKDRISVAYGAALALALVALQFGAIRLAPSELAVRIALPATIAAVPLALWTQRHRIGLWILFVGVAANLAAIVANGGLMPIKRSTVVSAAGPERAAAYADGAWLRGSKDVLLAPGSGHLAPLGDSIVIPIGGGGIVASPGDLVVWAGLIMLAGETSLAWQRRIRRADEATEESGATRVGTRVETAEGGATTPS